MSVPALELHTCSLIYMYVFNKKQLKVIFIWAQIQQKSKWNLRGIWGPIFKNLTLLNHVRL